MGKLTFKRLFAPTFAGSMGMPDHAKDKPLKHTVVVSPMNTVVFSLFAIIARPC
jgi:hypothetical protein